MGSVQAVGTPNHPVSSQRFVHKPDIAPMKIEAFDRCHTYLRGIVRKYYKEARRSFRALQIPALFDKHSKALIDVIKAVTKEEDLHKVTPEAVRWFFTTPMEAVGDSNLTEALAVKLNELEGNLPVSELNTEGVDEELQRYALDNPKCPPEVIEFAMNRPSAFAVFVSDSKYRPEIVSMFRSMISENERGVKIRTTADMIQEAFPEVAKCKK